MSDPSITNLLLSLCRNDQEDELEKLLEDHPDCNVNYIDGAGNTAAHYAAKAGSIGCLEKLVNLDDIDLDIKNHLEGDTPLHKAVLYQDQDHEMAVAMVDLLLMGGADPRIINRNKLTPAMLVRPKHKDIKDMLDEAVVSYELDDSDIANDDDSGSEVEEENDSDSNHP
ncbi:ankyrin repeat-containing domain protein [Phycomyces nitens]|nr:ankyrin repeat-containing domain protein [Phycomyces nitens]